MGGESPSFRRVHRPIPVLILRAGIFCFLNLSVDEGHADWPSA